MKIAKIGRSRGEAQTVVVFDYPIVNPSFKGYLASGHLSHLLKNEIKAIVASDLGANGDRFGALTCSLSKNRKKRNKKKKAPRFSTK